MATIMTKRGQLDNVVTYEHICDTVADMANINPSYVTLGSVCIVIKGENDDLEVYMADSRKEWKIISSSSGESDGGSSSGIHICAQDEYDSVTGMPTIEDPLSNTFYLTPGGNETNDLYSEWIWLEEDEEWEKFGTAANGVSDVQVNGVSVVTDGVANVPIASASEAGVIKVIETLGIKILPNSAITIVPPTSNFIKNGTNTTRPLIAGLQHESTFYGLAKAAGDTTQSESSNAVGTYTPEAKAAIKDMLGITEGMNIVTVSGTTPSIKASGNTQYVCGEVLSLDFTPSATGICDVIFTSGSSLTVLTLPNTVKMPEWFEVEANKVYEISITNGVYGAVMVWENA